MATAESTATPSAPPICWVVLTRPEARPESRSSTPSSAPIDIVTKAEADADPGHDQRQQIADVARVRRDAGEQADSDASDGEAATSGRRGPIRVTAPASPTADDERRQRQRQPGEAGLERRVAEDLLQVQRDDEEHPVDRRAEENAGDVRARERREPEDPERHERRGRTASRSRRTPRAGAPRRQQADRLRRAPAGARPRRRGRTRAGESAAVTVAAPAESNRRRPPSAALVEQARGLSAITTAPIGHVEEEDPLPADGLGDHAADEQAERAARGPDGAPDAERLVALGTLAEGRHQDRERRRESSLPRRLPAAARAAISKASDGASPPSSDASAKRRPRRRRRDACRAGRLPVRRAAADRRRSARRRSRPTAGCCENPRSAWIGGRATFTIATSRMTMKKASRERQVPSSVAGRALPGC